MTKAGDSYKGLQLPNVPRTVGYVVYFVALLLTALFVWWHICDVIVQKQILQTKGQVVDFVLFYAAGWMLRTAPDQAAQIYNSAAFTHAIQQLTQPFEPAGTYRFFYPPFMVAVFFPFTLAPLQWAWGMWTAFCVLAAAGAVKILDQRQGVKLWLAVCVASAASLPAFFNFRVGQTGILLLAGSALFFYFCRQQKYFHSGIATALLLAKPQFAPLFLVAGCVVGRWQYVRGAAVAVLLLLIACLPVGGLSGIIEFVRTMFSADVHRELTELTTLENLRGLIMLLPGTSPRLVLFLCLALTVLTAVLTGVLWLRYRRLNRHDEVLFGVLSACTLLFTLAFTVHVLPYDYLALSVVAMLLWPALDLLGRRKYTQWSRVLLLIMPFLSWGTFVFLPLVTMLQGAGPAAVVVCSPLLLILVHPLFIGSVAQLWLAWLLARERLREATTT
ncbi:MAG TPA: glycosyltransferase family 87 protein [Candidatus Obscuribacterales bacterium]